MNAVIQWGSSHFLAAISAAVASSGLITHIAIRFISSKAPAFIESEIVLLLNAALGKINSPADKAAAKAVLNAIRARFPDAGSSLYAQAADAVIREVPAFAPYRADLIVLFSGIEQAAADGLDAEIK